MGRKFVGGHNAAWSVSDSVARGFDIANLPYFDRGGRIDARAPDAAAAPVTPTSANEVSYLNGLNPDGSITNTSYWGSNGETAYKWGESTAGTAATITYNFRTTSNFTAQEKATFEKAFALWASVANITFVESASASADVSIRRGTDGNAYNSTPTSDGSGTTLGEVTGQSIISIDNSTPGFELTGSFDKYGGYGLSTIIHEIGHMIGLGHGGGYNGAVNPRTQQFSAYDDLMYTVMSYISWADGTSKFSDQNPVQGTDWGVDSEGYERVSPHTFMQLDILAIQQLYGVATDTPMTGGQTYGFNSNIAGLTHDFYDFTVNTAPIITLYNQGIGNTLDVSGYTMDQVIDLHAGSFSSVGGMTNNISIAQGTVIETAIGGSGNDTITASDADSTLSGGAGKDVLNGGAGKDTLLGGAGADSLFGNAGQDALTGGGAADVFAFDKGDSARAAKRADSIADFSHGQGDKIDLSGIDAIRGRGEDAFSFIGTNAFGNHAGELRFQVVGGDALVSGDINGDGKADFTIRLEDVTSLVAADFIL